MLFKSRACFTGPASEGKDSKFLAVNHDTLKLDLGEKKMAVHRFTILRPLSAGFASAPYKLKSPKRDPEAKVLSELRYGEDGHPVMRMWSFKKQGQPGNKGPRSDTSWCLRAGNTIKLWLDEERVKEGGPLAGEIPALSVCEISVAPKNEESVRNGWCIKITSVRPVGFSLHSMIGDLHLLSSSLSEARTRELALLANEQQVLEKELETQSVAFLLQVRREAQLDESGGTLKIVNLGDPFHVEIPTEALLSATNCTRMDWACAMLEVAIAAGALSLLVVANDFWKGGPRAVPIVSATTLFSDVTGPGTFKTPFLMDVDGNEAEVWIQVGADRVAVAGSKPPASDDYELTGLDAELAAAYPVQFDLHCHDKTVPAIWKGYLNAGPTRCQPVMAKRKRFQTMDE